MLVSDWAQKSFTGERNWPIAVMIAKVFGNSTGPSFLILISKMADKSKPKHTIYLLVTGKEL